MLTPDVNRGEVKNIASFKVKLSYERAAAKQGITLAEYRKRQNHQTYLNRKRKMMTSLQGL